MSSNLSPGGGGGGGDSPTDDGSGSDGSDGGGGGGVIWSTIAPEWIQDLRGFTGILTAFAANPRNFIIGAVASTILEVVFGAVTEAVNLIIRVFLGSSPQDFNAPGETLGIADLPFALVEPLLDAGGSVGDSITAAINALNEPIFALAGSAGPLSPVIITAAVVLEGIALVWIVQRLVFILLDLLQLGGLTE